jgi:hypothetical protein
MESQALEIRYIEKQRLLELLRGLFVDNNFSVEVTVLPTSNLFWDASGCY